MLVLAIDTSTPAVTAGIVESVGLAQRSVRVVHDARKHAELLMPSIQDACADAGVTLADLAAIVVGVGPGPFTGLRVGIVTAAALGDALEVPVHGVCSLDAIASDVPGERVLVVSDARRREVYWAAYDGARIEGPVVERPDALAARLPALGMDVAAGGMAAAAGLPVRDVVGPSPRGLVAVADLAAEPGPLEPLYLRRPDAVPPGERKRVTA